MDMLIREAAGVSLISMLEGTRECEPCNVNARASECSISLDHRNSCTAMEVAGGRVAPGKFHPEALAEPYVTLSRHTAPIKEPPRILVQCANRYGERRETVAIQCRARRT